MKGDADDAAEEEEDAGAGAPGASGVAIDDAVDACVEGDSDDEGRCDTGA